MDDLSEIFVRRPKSNFLSFCLSHFAFEVMKFGCIAQSIVASFYNVKLSFYI